MKSSKEIIDYYKYGTITFLEMEGLLVGVISDESISETMRLLFESISAEKVARLVDNWLDLLKAAESGERLFRFHGPDLDKEERLDLIRRLSAVAKYISGEIV